MKRINRRFRRTMAMLCAVVMFLTSVCIPSVSAVATDNFNTYAACEGEKVSAITLLHDDKLQLNAKTDLAGQLGYSWQIRDPENKEHWINITGANSDTLWVTYALVGSMLQKDGSAAVRCRITKGALETFTNTVKVTVSFAPPENEKPEITTNLSETPVAAYVAKRAPEDDTYITHSIVINYLFDNNALAFEPYGATVAHGSDFKETITSPTVVGYKPVRRVGENYVDAKEVVLDLTNIQADVIINIVYEPALVNFSVHHHLQNLYDDEYSLHYDYVTTSQAITGTIVGDGLAMTEDQLPGFRPLAYEKLPVAADGSTVIEIRYDRNYYLIDFDMNGGYGTEPVYTRYGASVGANIPIRHGYVFDGWELVSYNGRTPTAQEIAQNNISASATISVPAANLRYRAKWITQQTTYTMVFWKENAHNNSYSYWGYLDNLSAMSGSLVSAQNWASRAADINDSQYFTFNAAKSDKDVLVEGDGSTVVNVYYTRNYYKLTIKATGLCTIPEKHTHTDECYDVICNGGHVHTDQCGSELICTTPEHSSHTEECIKCGLTEHIHGSGDCACKITEHPHVKACWTHNIGTATTPQGSYPKDPENAEIYSYSRYGWGGYTYYYYIYLFGQWYNYTGSGVSNKDIVDPNCGLDEHQHGTNCNCNQQAHTHDDSCYRDALHTHGENCYTFLCGVAEHIHEAACKRLKCGITTGHTHNSTCKNARSSNTVKTVYRKYQQSLTDIWPITDDNGKTYNSGERWKPSESSYYSEVLVYLAEMPPDDFTLTLNEADYDTFIMNYYLQVLPGDPWDVSKDGKYYKLRNTVKANYNYLTYDEDFFEIKGFVRYDSDPNFGSNNQLDINGGGTVNMFYDRGTDNPLTFSNRGEILDDKTVPKNMYEIPLKEFDFVPEYPSNLEPGAYTFTGWYSSPGCFKGTEVDWDTLRMEDGGLQLFAKWSPITHRVRVFKDATMTEQIGADQIVDHKAFAHAPEGNVSNGNYVFHGWFYKDMVNGQEVEKAFVFTGIPILKDMDIYAKWSSHISVEYKIEYKLHSTGETIADPTTGTAIAGNNKTFPAKAGAELYEGFQTGYYPLVNSHTITMSADGNHTFTFYYVYVETMPYKVRYVDSLTGEDLIAPKVEMDNNLSVVTETFQRVNGKMPDAYQKRLVLMAEGTNVDENGIFSENTITFYYNSDDEHAYYRVVHYIENISGDDYREYRSEEAVGDIGSSYTFDALTLTGFSFDGSLTKVNGQSKPVSGNKVTAKLSNEGLLVELYYQRDTVPYKVRYLDRATGNEIYPAKESSGVFGQLLPEYAMDLSDMGYELIGEQVKTLTLSANPDYNVVDFYYQEKIVSIKYQIVGPADGGTLSQTSQNVQAISGQPSGSVPTAKEGFKFIGWYLDETCKSPVPAEWVNPQTHQLIPVKTGDVWQDSTYYAKIIALETDLTIEVQGSSSLDAKQSYLFRIVGKENTETEGIDLTVTVVGNSSVTVTKLPVGNYTVTELTSWAWRYENDESVLGLFLEYSETGSTITFNQDRAQIKWLDGNAVNTNLFALVQ